MPSKLRVRVLASLAVAAASLAAQLGVAQQLGPPQYGPGGAQQPAGTAPTPGAPGAYAANPAATNPGAPQQGPIGPTTQLPPQGPATPVQPPAPPFQLSDVELNFVKQVLQMWEIESTKITTYNSKFTRLEYDAVFGPGAEVPMVQSTGQLSYSKPDKGSFKVDEIQRWEPTDPKDTRPNAPGAWKTQEAEIGEHWVCDGKAVYEFDHRQKQLKVIPLPPQLRGEQIVNGPLPFLFGAKADKMLERYWLRVLQSDPASLRIEAFPRWQSDAANYQRCDVILDRKTMQPTALQVHLPGGNQRHVYMFEKPTINGTFDGLFGNLFSAPRTPLGWKKVVIDESADNAAQAAAPSETQRQ